MSKVENTRAVFLDDKWPSFDWTHREIRATLCEKVDSRSGMNHRPHFSKPKKCVKLLRQVEAEQAGKYLY